jgi:biopolymer transport protein ExbD
MRRRILLNVIPHAALLLVLIFLVSLRVWPRRSTGFRVRIDSGKCDHGALSRLIILRVSANGDLFLNFEPVDRRNLATRLSEIFETRNARALYLKADENTSYQMVIDAIDAMYQITPPRPHEGVLVPKALRTSVVDAQGIDIRLVTPGALTSRDSEGCFTGGKQVPFLIP